MEKELNIILNRENENVVSITSNFQEDLDLLETEEIVPIILDLLNNLIEKMKRDVVQQEIEESVLEDIENDEAQEIMNKVNERISRYMGNLFYEIINFVNNKDTEEPKSFDYSLAVYGMNQDDNIKEVYETYHYRNVKKHEKLLSCFAFYKDITNEILENNSKEETKQLLKQVFSVMLTNIYSYIEKHA